MIPRVLLIFDYHEYFDFTSFFPVLGEVLGNSIYQKNHHGNHPHSSLDLLDSGTDFKLQFKIVLNYVIFPFCVFHGFFPFIEKLTLPDWGLNRNLPAQVNFTADFFHKVGILISRNFFIMQRIILIEHLIRVLQDWQNKMLLKSKVKTKTKRRIMMNSTF